LTSSVFHSTSFSAATTVAHALSVPPIVSAQAGLVSSMSRKGMPHDNAMMESFFSSLKQELTHHERFADRDDARSQVFDYIVFYNRQRLHSGLGYRSPAQFEKMAVILN